MIEKYNEGSDDDNDYDNDGDDTNLDNVDDDTNLDNDDDGTEFLSAHSNEFLNWQRKW